MAGAVLDERELLDRIGSDPGLLSQLVQAFSEEATARIDALRTALRDGDDERSRREAHSLKGLAANLGAHRAADTSRRIEDLIRAGDRNAALALLADLDREVAAARVELAAALTRLRGENGLE